MYFSPESITRKVQDSEADFFFIDRDGQAAWLRTLWRFFAR
jgi:hypothetical protein